MRPGSAIVCTREQPAQTRHHPTAHKSFLKDSPILVSQPITLSQQKSFSLVLPHVHAHTNTHTHREHPGTQITNPSSRSLSLSEQPLWHMFSCKRGEQQCHMCLPGLQEPHCHLQISSAEPRYSATFGHPALMG